MLNINSIATNTAMILQFDTFMILGSPVALLEILPRISISHIRHVSTRFLMPIEYYASFWNNREGWSGTFLPHFQAHIHVSHIKKPGLPLVDK
jgi:hypothetical protein